MRRIQFIQHVPYESPGHIAAWAEARGHALAGAMMFEHPTLPAAEAFDALIVLGGPMGVRDDSRFPWLAEEKRLIQASILDGKPVLGICLGAQLIAHVLGARVYRSRFKEIGWLGVEATEEGRNGPVFTLPPRFVAYQWHGDTFDLPAGSTHLAHSAACEHQAFAMGKHVLGLQFHLEMTRDGIDALIDHCRADLGAGPYVQSPRDMQSGMRYLADAHALVDSLLDRWMEA